MVLQQKEQHFNTDLGGGSMSERRLAVLQLLRTLEVLSVKEEFGEELRKTEGELRRQNRRGLFGRFSGELDHLGPITTAV